jgi:hypothetical protein
LVTVKSRRGLLELTQSRFTNRKRNFDTIWHIPIEVRSIEVSSGSLVLGEITKLEYMDQTEKAYNIEGSYFLLNPGRVGYYRILYDAKFYKFISPHIINLNPVDRAGLLSDTLQIIATERLDIDVFEFCEFLRSDRSETVWKCAISCLGLFTKHFKTQKWIDFVKLLVRPISKAISWEDVDTPFYGIRKEFLDFCIWIGDELTIATGNAYFEDLLQGTCAANQSLITNICICAVKTNGKVSFDSLFKKNLDTFRFEFFLGLLEYKSETLNLINRYYELLRPQQAILMFQHVLTLSDGYKLLWSILKKQNQWIRGVRFEYVVEECVAQMDPEFLDENLHIYTLAVRRGLERNWFFSGESYDMYAGKVG